MLKEKPVILSISALDSSALRGVEADVKTALKLNTYCTVATTCVTSQNTQRSISRLALSSSMVYDQIKAASEDFHVGCVKIGLISNINQAKAVKDALDKYFNDVPVVLDPVIASKFGHIYTDSETLDYIKDHIFAKVTLITPNMKEAEVLSGMKVTTVMEMVAAAQKLHDTYGISVLITGGALEGELKDVLVIDGIDGIEKIIDRKRVDRAVFGLGATVSTAIATYLAKGYKMEEAVRFGLEYLTLCLQERINLGQNEGAIWHI